MIAFRQLAAPASRRWHAVFLKFLPTIERYAQQAFVGLTAEQREEAIQEVLANACVACFRLAQRERLELAYPTVLARFAIAQFWSGRQVGNHLNGQDALSSHAQRKHGFRVERLQQRDPAGGLWLEAVVEDRRTPVLEQVRFRVDFADWLARLPQRKRQVAEALALGHATWEVAQQSSLSNGRVSQLRRELEQSWQAFDQETARTEPA
jgi:DNA-binding NarL/FixJ family response regulator